MNNEQQLDNLAWHALTGPHAGFAERSDDGVSARYVKDVSTFCAVDQLDDAAWASLHRLTDGRSVILARGDEIAPPEGWEERFRHPLAQYVAVDPPDDPGLDVEALGAVDADEMLALTRLTEPGPFFSRTHEMGRYIGLREGGELIAMAGERLRTDSFTEISAVCVHPNARRRGLGAALTTTLVHDIRSRGHEAMLHVAQTNDPAHRLYETLGFELRTHLTVGAWRIPWSG